MRTDNSEKCGINDEDCGRGDGCRIDNGYAEYCMDCACATCSRSRCNPTVSDMKGKDPQYKRGAYG